VVGGGLISLNFGGSDQSAASLKSTVPPENVALPKQTMPPENLAAENLGQPRETCAACAAAVS
jgi:hypothetical protein